MPPKIHHRASTPGVKEVRHKGGEAHAHGCTECGRRYTDACMTTSLDQRCGSCRSKDRHGVGWERAVWDRDSDPVPCCYGHSVLASVEERQKFRLAGSVTWWRCSLCSRTHPFKPVRGTT